MSRNLISLISGSILLSACSGDYAPTDGQQAPMSREDARKTGFGSVLGDDVLLFGAPKKYDPSQTGVSRVNHFLWQASLDVLSFMPLASSDAAGGVLVTDWYSTADRPNERIKVAVEITDRVLRADAVHVRISKQIKKAGDWIAVSSDVTVSREMEDLILTKARDLKIKTGK